MKRLFFLNRHWPLIFVFAPAVFFFVFACNQPKLTMPGPSDGTGPFGTVFCAVGTPDSLCPFIPHEVDDSSATIPGYRTHLDTIDQPKFDEFSWQSFVALNWPANNSGAPSGYIIGNDTSARVWEYYSSADDVFGGVSDACDPGTPGSKFLFHPLVSSSGGFTTAGFTENDGNALIDRNLNFALYEIMMSPAEVAYVEANQLNTLSGQQAFVDSLKKLKKPLTIDLPSSYYTVIKSKTGGEVGTIEIKASWRLLLPNEKEIWDRFYNRDATIYIPGANRKSGKDTCFTARVGLVGMHIITKTKLFPIMVWSTFEHVDNTPDDLADAAQHPDYPWSFYNPNCLNCLVNTPADTFVGNQNKLIWANKPPFAKAYGQTMVNDAHVDTFGTQVTRTYPIYGPTQRMNAAWQQKLKGSVWANYKLVGSQWLSSHNEPIYGVPNPPPAPELLGNTVIETFMQDTSSCIRCHNGATNTFSFAPDTLRYDFSFLIFRGLSNKGTALRKTFPGSK
ncbi:MAG TPA: hypothetical protein VFG10_12565 [Saprospiraceae bacterium]|nr:hypothetical protein [Saprospiraceae bacterium]